MHGIGHIELLNIFLYPSMESVWNRCVVFDGIEYSSSRHCCDNHDRSMFLSFTYRSSKRADIKEHLLFYHAHDYYPSRTKFLLYSFAFDKVFASTYITHVRDAYNTFLRGQYLSGGRQLLLGETSAARHIFLYDNNDYDGGRVPTLFPNVYIERITQDDVLSVEDVQKLIACAREESGDDICKFKSIFIPSFMNAVKTIARNINKRNMEGHKVSKECESNNHTSDDDGSSDDDTSDDHDARHDDDSSDDDSSDA